MNRVFATVGFLVGALFAATGVSVASDVSAHSSVVSCITSDIQSLQARYAERIEARRSVTAKGNYVEQPISDIRELYRQAMLNKPTFDRTLKMIAKSIGVEAVTTDLKEISRSKQKVSNKLLGNVSALTDLVRGTIICDRYAQIEAIKESISSRFSDVKFIDRFENPKANGYRDLQAVVLIPAFTKGQVPIWAEIQVHLRPLYEAKKKAGDDLYRRWRKIEEYGVHHPLSEDELNELSSLKDLERELYDEALLKAL